MTKMLIIGMGILFLCSGVLSATIINVPNDYPTIQQGINASEDADTVLVQPGTYFENINFNGKNITVASLFLITQDTSYISETIIDGNYENKVVKFVNGENRDARMIGFKLQHGALGGVWCDNSMPTISNNIIIDNEGSWPIVSRGINCREASPKIINNTISLNDGGISVNISSNPIIAFNKISSNRFDGIYITDYSYPVIYNNHICNNSHAGVWCHNNAYPIISNNIISENNEDGIYSRYSSSFIVNNTIASNVLSGIYSFGAEDIIKNSIIWGNSTSFTFTGPICT